MESFSIFDKSFDLHKTKHYVLALQLSNYDISFCILDTVWKKYLALKHISFDRKMENEEIEIELNSLFKMESCLNKTYKKVSVMYITSRYTFVPEVFYQKENMFAYYAFNQNVVEREDILENHIPKCESMVLYGLPSKTNEIINEQFANPIIFHQSCSLLNNLLQPLDATQNDVLNLSVSVYRDSFDVVVYQGDKLKLYNTFSYKTENDFVYFIMFVLEKMKMNPRKTDVKICGSIQNTSNRFKLLSKYIKSIQFIDTKEQVLYSEKFVNIQPHFFSNLLNLYQCE